MPYNSINTRRSSRARREAEQSSEDVIVTPSPNTSKKTIAPTSKKKSGGRVATRTSSTSSSSSRSVVSVSVSSTVEVVPKDSKSNLTKKNTTIASTIAPTRRSGGGRRPATSNSTTTATITTEEEENNTNGNVNSNVSGGRVVNQVVNVPTVTKEEGSEIGQSSSTSTEVEGATNRVARISISTRRSAAAARSSISSSLTTTEPSSKDKRDVGEKREESVTTDSASAVCGGGGGDLGVEEPFGRLAHDIVVIETSSESGGSVVCEEDEVKGQEEDGSGSEFEGDPGATGCQSFVVIVNPDGTLVLDSEKQIQQLAPGQEKFEVNLPKDKVKSASNPLPGAVQVQPQRARKSRPEGVTYGGSSGFGFVTSTPRSGQAKTQPRVIEIDLDDPRESGMSVGINHPAHVIQPSATPIDMDEFTNQLDPQSLATLETLIHSEQGREIIQTLEYNPSATTVCVEVPETAKPAGWSQSYSGGDKNSTHESSIVSQNPSSVSAASSAASSPAGSRPSSVGKGGKGRSSSGSRLSEGRSSDRHQRSFDADSDDCFSGDAGNIRRSLRQQDRVEKQEAERILAENQKMLKREKEIMKEAVAQKVLSPGIAAVASESPNPGPKPAALVGVSNKVASPVPAVRKTSTPVPKVESPITDGKRPYPKRENRKLPAHLADPNYVSLEEDSGKNHKDGSVSERSTGSGSRRSSTATKQEDLEDEVDHGASGDDDDEEYTEDDPDRLWCICRQPHNNRFMICCDTCEEWFHGKCVNVTKAQGKAMELKNMTWNCPPCRKLLAERNKRHVADSKNRRRASEPPSKSESSSKLSKSAVAQKAEAAAAASAAGLAQTPEKIAAQSPATGARRVAARKSIPTEKVAAQEPVHGCVVCGKASRKDSIYCTDLCVQKYAETVGNKSGVDKGKSTSPPSVPRPVTSTPSTPTSASKLKRTLSTKQESKSDDSIFAFHVITPGASKSTEVVPPKPKELTASQLLKTQREEAARAAANTANSASPTSSPTKSTSFLSPAHSANQPSVPGVSPNSVNAIISSTPTVVVKKITNSDGKSVVKLPGKISKDSSLKMETSEEKHKSKEKDSSSKRSRNASASDSKLKTASSRKSDSSKAKEREVEKDKDRDGPSSEKLHRENMKKGLRELLKSRLKELSEEEQEKIVESSNNPESVASKIEEELCRIYGGANNPKCRAKYRSIFFNLKDAKNCLYYELLQGNVKPKHFVKMEPHEMASAELAEWRKRENQKEMDAIKKSELDKIAEANKILLLEKGVDDAVKVAEETRPHDISDVIDANLQQKDKTKAPEKEKSRSSGDKSRSSSGSHGRSKRDKERDEKSSSHKDKERRRSERHKSEKDTEKDRKLRDREKDSLKVKSSDLKNKSSERKHSHSKGQESEKDKSNSGKLDKQSEVKKPQKDSEISTPSESISSGDGTPSSQVTPPDSKQEDVRHSTDSEQELPSSTIKTPDFTDETAVAKKDSDTKPLFQSKIVMPELGGFNASVHAVSHFSTEGLIFPESPVPVVGRISPETVWDYINKMKKTKEVIVLRLSPSTPADSEGYMTFFSYFSSRGRLGVIGGISAPLKDVYLVPLDKHSPVNRSLLPFRGPGLPAERTHCLLCVVTRHITDGSVPLPLKRKSNLAADSVAVKKRVKFGPEQEGTNATKSSSASSKASPAVPKIPALRTTEDIKDEDDDAPYTPWEEEEEKEEVNAETGSDETMSTSASTEKIINIEDEVQKQLKELEERIAKEKQDIEKITGALAGRQTSSCIPGLDGEFPLYQEELTEVKKTSSLFLSLPVKQPQTAITIVDQESITITKMEISSLEMSESETATVESVIEKPEVVDIIEDSSSKESESDSQNDQAMGDSEEAYSPSAMQFSDEDLSQLGTSQKEKIPEESPKIQDLPDKEPILEPERLEPAIKISLKKLNLKPEKPTSPSLAAPSSSPVKSAADLIDLEPEPAPPGEVVLKPPPPLTPLTPQKPPSNKPEPVFEALGTKFATTKKGKGPISLNIGQLPKMKININLTTKQLPVAEVDVDKSIETKEAIRAASAAILTSQNPMTTATSAKTEAVQSPSIQNLPAQPPMSIPIHLPPPHLQHPPGIPLPAVVPAALTHIPVHLPPPTLKQTAAPSVVINLNVPPPPIPSLRPLTQQPPVSLRFPSGLPLTGDFSNNPPRPGPPQLKTMPSLQPAFSPISTGSPSAGSVGSIPEAGFGSFGDKDIDTRTPARGFEQTSPDTSNRVERVNLDRDSGRHDRDRGVRDLRGRNFGRRQPERNRRNRSRSGERNRSRSRSRSRERRVRRRHTRSRSRSKSPLSKRWEARNRSRSPGKRNRLK